MRSRARKTIKADETPEFVQFWTEVWKPHMNPNDGRGAARDEFFRHVEEYGADPQDIVDGARWFIHKGGNQRVGSDGNLIQQHASSWLSKRAYEDGADDWRELQRAMAERREKTAQNVVQMPERRVKTAYMLSWERQHGKDYFEHFDEQKRRTGE